MRSTEGYYSNSGVQGEIRERILVIKHGALGDVILATGPFAAIRAYHPDAHITLLTTPPYAAFLKGAPYFDDIWVDTRPKWWECRRWWKLYHQLNAHPWARVYDLQTSKRSTLYYRLFKDPKPEFSGIAVGASHCHDTEERTTLHTTMRQKQQLAIAGISHVPAPDVHWLSADIEGFSLPDNFCLLIPGGSAHRPEKRWPKAHYQSLARWCVQQGIIPLLIGAKAEEQLLSEIAQAVRGSINLCGKTSLGQMAELARRAQFAVGNDTGPMHLIANANCPSLVLFSAASNPSLCGPRGRQVRIMRRDDLAMLKPQEITACLPFAES